MFGLGNGSKDDERFWNLLMFKVYATDEEILEMSPYVLVGVIIFIIIVGVYCCS
jgi:hypothetical protein